MNDGKLLSDDHDPPPPAYERQPNDPDPADTTLADVTLDDIARMDTVAHDADPTLVVNLGGQNAIADSGIDLEGRDHQTTDSEHLDSLVDVGPDEPGGVPFHAIDPYQSSGVPVAVFADVGKRHIRRCIGKAFDVWMTNVIQTGKTMPPGELSAFSSDMMKLLHAQIMQNLREEDIPIRDAWPEVIAWVRHLFNDLIVRVFELGH